MKLRSLLTDEKTCDRSADMYKKDITMQGKGKKFMEIIKSNNFEDFPASKMCIINNDF